MKKTVIFIFTIIVCMSCSKSDDCCGPSPSPNPNPNPTGNSDNPYPVDTIGESYVYMEYLSGPHQGTIVSGTKILNFYVPEEGTSDLGHYVMIQNSQNNGVLELAMNHKPHQNEIGFLVTKTGTTEGTEEAAFVGFGPFAHEGLRNLVSEYGSLIILENEQYYRGVLTVDFVDGSDVPHKLYGRFKIKR